MPTVLFLPPHRPVTREWAARLHADVPELDVRVAETREDAMALLPSARGAFGTLDPELLAVASSLAWLQAPAAAPPFGYFFDELADHPVVVTNFRGIFNDHVAHHAVALVLAIARRLPFWIDRQREHLWVGDRGDDLVIDLPHTTALVVGVGGIGGEVGRLLHELGMRVLGVDPRREDVPEGFESIDRPDELDRLLPEARIVVLAMPHTPDTERLFDADRIARMPRGAVLVNVGRGATVDLDALTAALRSGELRAAGLDVFEVEPLPADHPLWDAPGALLTPHAAAAGPFLDERRYAILRENARHLLEGTPFMNVVDKASGF